MNEPYNKVYKKYLFKLYFINLYANSRRMVQKGITSHLTHYRSLWRRFHRSDDPSNSVTALKDDG